MPESTEQSRPTPDELERFRETLPPLIEDPYPFVAINDLSQVAETMGVPPGSPELERLVTEFDRIQRRHAPPESTFFSVDSTSLSEALERTVRDSVDQAGERLGVVYLDQYLGRRADCPPHFRLELSRGSDEALMPRVGCSVSVEEQIAGLGGWAKRHGYDELLLVDDVLAFGSTVPVIVETLRAYLPDARIRLLTGLAASGGIWRGVENVREAGLESECLTKIMASEPIEGRTRGMALPVARDFTLFGGRGGNGPDGRQLSYPYFLPFSKPLLSLIDRPGLLASAEELLTFNESLVASLETTGRPELTVANLVEAGYGLPYTALESVKPLLPVPHPEQPLREVLNSARQVLHQHTERVMAELD